MNARYDVKKALVGNTGFVGSNLEKTGCFSDTYNSSNIEAAYGTEPDLLVYAGVRSEMFTANQNPEADMKRIKDAAHNILKINAKKVVLISTVAVYGDAQGKTENSIIDITESSNYGLNRYLLECWVQDNCKDPLIIRLPAIYGINMKKNFIYDIIHFIPGLLKKDKYSQLSSKSNAIKEAYIPRGDSFYALVPSTKEKSAILKEEFRQLGFSALNFTDSRSKYQFYNLKHLWSHINRALETDIRKLNITTEPITAEEVYRYVNHGEFENHIMEKPYAYDLRTAHCHLFGGANGYLFDKSFVLEDIKNFVERNTL